MFLIDMRVATPATFDTTRYLHTTVPIGALSGTALLSNPPNKPSRVMWRWHS